MRRTVEHLAALRLRGVPAGADGEEYLAVGAALLDEVPAVVGEVEAVLVVDRDAVRSVELTGAPRVDELAARVEDKHRHRAAVEDVDAVLRVHRN